MMNSSQYNSLLETEEIKQTLSTCARELVYERTFLKTKSVHNDEETRRFRVQILLHEDAKDEIYAGLLQSSQRVNDLESSNIRYQNQLAIAAGTLEKVRLEMRAKSRENQNLKAELESLQSVTSDSTKLLTEKLSLARELASLKPEIDHLRSQATSHQLLLSEKLALERQLSTLQVELETEKRSTQRAQVKESRLQAEDAKLESRIDSLQAEVAKERRQREKAERDAQITSADLESKKATFDSRMDAFRNKLRITKEQLRTTEVELQGARQTNAAIPIHSASSGLEKDAGRTARKRTAAQLDADSVIGTSGVLPTRKKSKGYSTLPGDKSTFSITPFLNRATNVNLEDPPKESASSDKEDEISTGQNPVDDQAEVTEQLVTTMSSELGPLQIMKTGTLKSTHVGKVNSRVPPSRHIKIAPSLQKVTEQEEEAEKIDTSVHQRKNQVTGDASDDTSTEHVDIKKKRRKLFGGDISKTLFDAEEEETTKGGRGRVVIGGRDGTTLLGKSIFNATNSRPRIGLAAPKSTFGTISPLKKDKRIVGI